MGLSHGTADAKPTSFQEVTQWKMPNDFEVTCIKKTSNRCSEK